MHWLHFFLHKNSRQWMPYRRRASLTMTSTSVFIAGVIRQLSRCTASLPKIADSLWNCQDQDNGLLTWIDELSLILNASTWGLITSKGYASPQGISLNLLLIGKSWSSSISFKLNRLWNEYLAFLKKIVNSEGRKNFIWLVERQNFHFILQIQY